MAVNLNSVTLTGNLTSDPDLRGNGNVCAMRVAVNGRRKDGDQWVDDANYFDVVVFGNAAENCAKYLKRGSGIGIVGRLDWSEYETENGKRQSVQVIASAVQFLNGNTETGTSAAAVSTPRSEVAIDDSGLDAIPF